MANKLHRWLYIIIAAFIAAVLAVPLVAFVYSKFLVKDSSFAAKGSVTLTPISYQDTTHVIPGSWTGDCSKNQGDVPIKPTPCFPSEIRTVEVSYTSANCGSSVVASIDPTNPHCVNVTEIRRGCGEDNILGIRNCRGRGWLDYRVTALGSQPVRGEPHTEKLQGDFGPNRPLLISFPADACSTPSACDVTYDIDISTHGTFLTKLNNKSPSYSDNAGNSFFAQVEPEAKKLIISANKFERAEAARK